MVCVFSAFFVKGTQQKAENLSLGNSGTKTDEWCNKLPKALQEVFPSLDDKTAEENVKDDIDLIEEARKSAQYLITQANQEAERISQQALDEAKITIEEAKKEAVAQSQIQKRQMQKELEKETISLVAEVVKKVLGRTLSEKERRELQSRDISNISKLIQ